MALLSVASKSIVSPGAKESRICAPDLLTMIPESMKQYVVILGGEQAAHQPLQILLETDR